MEDQFERWNRVEKIDKQQTRTLRKKEEFLKAFQQFGRNVSRTCKEIGIERKTFYNWKASDSDFIRALDEASQIKTDLLHDLYLIQIIRGHGPTVRHYLRHHHPDFKRKRRV